MEHLIVTSHNQTTWFVLFGIAVDIIFILNSSAAIGITTLVFGFYFYKAFRRFYGPGRVKTLLKFIIIYIIFFILAIIVAVFSVLASFAIY